VPAAGAAWVPALAPAGAPPTVKPGNDSERSRRANLLSVVEHFELRDREVEGVVRALCNA
jgi:hypothetical protein